MYWEEKLKLCLFYYLCDLKTFCQWIFECPAFSLMRWVVPHMYIERHKTMRTFQLRFIWRCVSVSYEHLGRETNCLSINYPRLNHCLHMGNAYINNGILYQILHPCEKVIEIFFNTNFLPFIFVLCSSFYTWYMWGGQYQFCKSLLDFDHWLYFSDILKKATGSKPDVASVWFMQWAVMELEEGVKYRYWCIVRV